MENEQELVVSKKEFTHQQALVLKQEILWRNLKQIPMREAVSLFLDTLGPHTKRAYAAAFVAIFGLSGSNGQALLSSERSLQEFSLMNVEALLDAIKGAIRGSEATKQARSAAFVSFTGFLQRKTEGMIRKAVPKRETTDPTFRVVRDKAHTKALSQAQWIRFFEALKGRSYRDYLIAKTTLQGAKRIEEVLSAKLDQIDWEKNQIRFLQSKARELHRETIITYPLSFMQELRSYVGGREDGFIFVTRTGNKVCQPGLYNSFIQAGEEAKIGKVSPHVLRASAITYLFENDFSADQIKRVSGHADLKLVSYYDKGDQAKNPTQKVSMI